MLGVIDCCAEQSEKASLHGHTEGTSRVHGLVCSQDNTCAVNTRHVQSRQHMSAHSIEDKALAHSRHLTGHLAPKHTEHRGRIRARQMHTAAIQHTVGIDGDRSALASHV